MTFGLRTKILFSFGLLIIISISNYQILTTVERNASEKQRWLLHTHEVIEKSEAFLGYLRDTETGQRGFLLTGQSAYLEPYNLGIAKARSYFELLKEMTKDNYVQQTRLEVIQEHMIEKLIELSKTIELAKQGKHEEVMDHIRHHLNDFKAEEEKLLALRGEQFTNSKNKIRMFFFVEAVMMLSIIVGVAMLIQKTLVSPLTLLTASITNMASGKEIEKISLTSTDEVGQLAMAFNKMRREVHDRTNELERQSHFDHAFSHVVTACFSSNDLTKALSQALIEHSNHHPSPLSAIYQYDENTEKLHCLATHGTSEGLLKTISVETGLIGQTYRSGKEMTVSADSVEGFHIEAGLANLNPRTIILQPITVGTKKLGVLVLAYTSELDQHDYHYIKNLSYQFGVTMINAQQYQSLQRLTKELKDSREQVMVERDQAMEKSITDPLTGLYNRQFLKLELEQLILISSRHGNDLTLIILDIDHFKQVNDTLGHQVGDEVLKAISTILKQETRASDLVIRFGGEEFIVILPQTSLDEGAGTAEKLRKAVEKLDGPDLEGKNITISLGVALLKKDEDIRGIINRADKALYRAKNEGRNQVSIARAS